MSYKKYPHPPKRLKPFKVYRSWLPNKKLVVLVVDEDRKKLVHFGHPDYKDYLTHRDKKRRNAYLKRSARIRDGKGNFTKDDPFSANFWARKILWKA